MATKPLAVGGSALNAQDRADVREQIGLGTGTPSAAGLSVLTAADAAAQRTAIGAASLTTAQTTAGATGVAGLTSAGVLSDLAGATVLTKSGTATAFPGPLLTPIATAGAPALASSSASTTGFYYTNVGSAGWYYANSGTPAVLFTDGFQFRNVGAVSWSSTGVGGTSDIILSRGGPGILDHSNGANAQRKGVFNTGNRTNGESFDIDWQTTANVCTIGTRAAGTGTLRPVTAVGAWTFGSATVLTPSASVTLGTNGQFAVEVTSNTAGNLVYRGSDGTTRRMALVFA